MFAGLGPVKAFGQCDPGKTVRSRYRIGVPGWAPISKACLVWLGIALPEINVNRASAHLFQLRSQRPDLLSLPEIPGGTDRETFRYNFSRYYK